MFLNSYPLETKVRQILSHLCFGAFIKLFYFWFFQELPAERVISCLGLPYPWTFYQNMVSSLLEKEFWYPSLSVIPLRMLDWPLPHELLLNYTHNCDADIFSCRMWSLNSLSMYLWFVSGLVSFEFCLDFGLWQGHLFWIILSSWFNQIVSLMLHWTDTTGERWRKRKTLWCLWMYRVMGILLKEWFLR